ncbi:MAG: lytic transglycosylase domain-containing protein [Nitrospirota bacterium]
MQKSSWTIINIHILLFLLISSYSHAQIYQYKDKEGTIHFTNVPTDKRFRLMDKKDEPGSKKAKRKEKIQPQTLNNAINSASKTHRIDPNLVKAVIKAESDFDPMAISPAGALGLMQLMPETAEQLNVFDPFNPEENIEAGTRYLSYLLDSFDGDLRMSLAAYNAGESLVRRHKSIPPFEETHHYIKKVLGYYRDFGGIRKNGVYRVALEKGDIIYTNRPEDYIRYQDSLPER